MSLRFLLASEFLLGLSCLVLPAQSQPPPGQPVDRPALEPVADTRLLMQGMANANFRGLERLLQQQPSNAQAWAFARGQALLIAETGNLLMLRPPKQKEAQIEWFQKAGQLRETATSLARAAARQDYVTSRRLLVSTANVCNSCHATFQVQVEITPFAQKPGK
jgi:hypothetical protein